MLELIEEHLLDLLAADPRLTQGGELAAEGFTGVKRVDQAEEPEAGSVNLFGIPFSVGPSAYRPAIYLGTQSREASDRQDFAAIGAGQIQYRMVNIPLVIVAVGGSQREAKRRRGQLASNVKRILLDHAIESGYWYSMQIEGEETSRSSGTGDVPTDTSEAHLILPVVCRYSRTAQTA